VIVRQTTYVPDGGRGHAVQVLLQLVEAVTGGRLRLEDVHQVRQRPAATHRPRASARLE